MLHTRGGSGTNLFITLSTYFFGQPVEGWRVETNRLNLPIDSSKPPLLRSHLFLANAQRLVILVRDYKEAFVNMTKYPFPQNDEEYIARFTNEGAISSKYFGVLRKFKDFQGEKILFYYEDLVTNPIEEMLRFGDFMGYDNDTEVTQSKIDHVEEVMTANLTSYLKQRSRNEDQKKTIDTKKYQKNFSETAIQTVNNHMQSQYPEFHEILSKY